MLRGFDPDVALQQAVTMSQTEEWKDKFAPSLSNLDIKKHFLRYVMFEAQKWEFANQLSSVELSSQLTYLPENCPPCLMHCDIRVCSKLCTAFFQAVHDKTSKIVMEQLNVTLNNILSQTYSDDVIHR